MIEKAEPDHREWLRKSFLDVDVEVEKYEGQKELAELRKSKPPKKPAVLSILQDESKESE